MLFSRVLAVSMLMLSPAAFAEGGGLDINLNNNAAQFQFSASGSDLIEGNAELHAGLLYNDTNNIFVDAGLLAKSEGESENGGPIIAVGAKGVFGSIHPPLRPGTTDTGSAIAVGGEFGFAIPSNVPIALIAQYYASPKIMTFADADRFNQFGVRLELAASPQARIYIGYREIGFGMKKTGSELLDSGTVAGVKVSF